MRLARKPIVGPFSPPHDPTKSHEMRGGERERVGGRIRREKGREGEGEGGRGGEKGEEGGEEGGGGLLGD
jgi:hypothetical protein